jgi:mRNA-degrading endonuclease RelE of RelBE toxin-antitoxin system
MTPGFVVHATSRFDRMARALRSKHPGIFTDCLEAMATILHEDPLNRNRRYDIKKLHGVASGEGQCRLRIGRFRFRYDIKGREVVIHRCGLRREDTYE